MGEGPIKCADVRPIHVSIGRISELVHHLKKIQKFQIIDVQIIEI